MWVCVVFASCMVQLVSAHSICLIAHRSCRARLAKHKDRQRLKWQAKAARQGSEDTASLEDDDEGQEAQQATQATVTRAGRKCRRPSLLLPSAARASNSDADTRPEPQQAAQDGAPAPQQQMPHSGVRPTAHDHDGSPTVRGDSFPTASSWGVQSIHSLGDKATCQHWQQQQQQQQHQRLPPSTFDQALAMSQGSGGLRRGQVSQRSGAGARASCSASMSQMQVPAVRTCWCDECRACSAVLRNGGRIKLILAP